MRMLSGLELVVYLWQYKRRDRDAHRRGRRGEVVRLTWIGVS